MNLKRIKLLEEYIEEDPKDPFNRYALALELAHEEQDRAIILLLDLIRDSPHYVPSYYQAAALLLEHNRLEEAKIVIEKGIDIARKNNEPKVASELKTLAEELD